ncbi:alpha/beta fold hydrolase [Amycolatopsis orientalis]|uniref:alpha/beta fold hydrolase n=1 Tax=Amycolatopsis orientalis TaxID=31958 RepID=UPI0003A85396|nr:alpha/beta hydrolase [Amycolatopsis orientalis]
MTDAEKTGASAPIVLISPAMAVGSGYYRPLVAEFERRGWPARALRRRGFERGEPRASRHEDWAYRDEIDDIAHAVAAARAESPARPVLLLGHSLGGQLVAGHELTRPPADGVITVGGAIPRYRHFACRGLHLAVMAALVVPVATAVFGYLPKPAFGGPGARTFMREWARMVLTGRPPYPVEQPITTPSLVISLGEDRLSPVGAVDDLAERLFAPDSVTRWHYPRDQAPPGATNDHIGWVRTPAAVVDRIVRWWPGAARG